MQIEIGNELITVTPADLKEYRRSYTWNYEDLLRVVRQKYCMELAQFAENNKEVYGTAYHVVKYNDHLYEIRILNEQAAKLTELIYSVAGQIEEKCNTEVKGAWYSPWRWARWVANAIGVLLLVGTIIPGFIWFIYAIVNPEGAKRFFVNFRNGINLILRRFIIHPLQALVATLCSIPYFIVNLYNLVMSNGKDPLIDEQKRLRKGDEWARWFKVPLWALKEEDQNKVFFFYGVFDFTLFLTVVTFFAFAPNIPLGGSRYQFFWLVLLEGLVRIPQLIIEAFVRCSRLSKTVIVGPDSGKYIDSDSTLRPYNDSSYSGVLINTKWRKRFEYADIIGSTIANGYACLSVFVLVSYNMFYALQNFGSFDPVMHLTNTGFVTFISASLALTLYWFGRAITKGIFCAIAARDENLKNANEGKEQFRKDRIRYWNDFINSIQTFLSCGLTGTMMMLGQNGLFIMSCEHVLQKLGFDIAHSGATLVAAGSFFAVFGMSLCAASLLAGVLGLIVDAYFKPNNRVNDVLIRGTIALILAIVGLSICAPGFAAIVGGAALATALPQIGVAFIACAIFTLFYAMVKQLKYFATDAYCGFLGDKATAPEKLNTQGLKRLGVGMSNSATVEQNNRVTEDRSKASNNDDNIIEVDVSTTPSRDANHSNATPITKASFWYKQCAQYEAEQTKTIEEQEKNCADLYPSSATTSSF